MPETQTITRIGFILLKDPQEIRDALKNSRTVLVRKYSKEIIENEDNPGEYAFDAEEQFFPFAGAMTLSTDTDELPFLEFYDYIHSSSVEFSLFGSYFMAN